MKPAVIAILSGVAAFLLNACGQQHADAEAAKPATPAYVGATYAPTLKKQPSVADMTALGRTMFSDPSLSASGKMSCATCHSPDHAFGPPNNLAVQLGGKEMKTLGTRAVPSLRYIQNVPAFTEHFFDDDGDDSIDAGPTGGHNWDGRAPSTHDQARIPLLSAHEMGNANAAEVVEKLKKASYVAQFRATFGEDIFDSREQAFKWALMALEVFQESPTEFYPYNSKYDAFLRQQTQLSKQELNGLRLFNDASKGNCASCHISEITASGAFPQFTDYGLIAIGVPRNKNIPANADPKYFDMGLCGPDRTDLKDKTEYCGLFKTPSLRNVATRQVFFHNGAFTSLEQVMKFYVQRDTQPQKWYPRDKEGKVRKFDDLPEAYHGNVNVEAPFDRKPGDRPALTDGEIKDVIAFLKTLNDGFHP
ncbi:cytochrome c family protein [Collimonas fungivorans]|uniref:Cytochrome c family protein n=1 Tax=Collimonas fungivorans TaxID=158899 RepID=A0A127P5G6_9BURK|nr:cytochrome c peroxidase [Collimonas fungivorans]AMO92924.1 cytochrome c family protein [Collimonas fungivorans]